MQLSFPHLRLKLEVLEESPLIKPFLLFSLMFCYPRLKTSENLLKQKLFHLLQNFFPVFLQSLIQMMMQRNVAKTKMLIK